MNLRTANKNARKAERENVSRRGWALWDRMAEKANRTGNFKPLNNSGFVRRQRRKAKLHPMRVTYKGWASDGY